MHESAPGQSAGANMPAVNYFVSCVSDETEVGFGFLRQALLGDAGIGGGKRYDDSEEESWKGDSGKPSIDIKSGRRKDPLDSLVPPDMAELDKEISKSDFHAQAGKVERHSKRRFGSIEAFLEFLDKQQGGEGAFIYNRFKLAEFKEVVPEKMREEVAIAFARLAIQATKEAREGLTKAADMTAAVRQIADVILAS